MNDRETNFEQNLGRLIKASCGPENYASSDARERLRRDLAATLHQRLQPVEFPAASLGLLTVMVLLLLASCGLSSWRGSHELAGRLLNSPMLTLVIVNMACIPIASLIIILRRKYE
jgi:hypothetical protein